MKKVLLTLLVCVVGICCMSIGVSATTYEGTDGNITWVYDSDTTTLTISGSGDMNDYNSYAYTPWSSYRTSITTVVIEEGVTSIGKYAFEKCSSLKSITIPDSVTSIGIGSFSDCTSLTSITIPDSVTSIGYNAFYYCSSLTSIIIPDGVTSIEQYTFKGCSNLTSIIISGSVTAIGVGAFSNCSNLTEAYYLGSRGNVTIADYNTYLTNNLHYMTLQSATDATCDEDGNIAYYSCNTRGCNVAIYIDDDGNYVTTTLDDENLVLAIIDHSYEYTQNNDGTHLAICSECGDETAEDCTLEWTLANDSSNKVITATCSYCEQVYTLTVEITLESDEYTYTGEEIEPTIVSVTINGEDVTYTATYMNNINVTEDGATVVIALTDYDGVSVETYFAIVEEEEEEEEEEEDEEEDTDEEEDNTDEDTTEDTDSTTDDTSDSTDTDTSTSTDDTTDTSTSTDTTSSTYTNAYIQYIGGILMSGNTSTSTVEDVSTGAGMTAEGSTTSSALAVVSLIGVAMMVARKRK